LSRGYEAAKGILLLNLHVLEIVAQHLIENESLDAEEFATLVAESGPVVPDGLAWMGV
jgi:ATP-dependent Zn protease